MATSEKQLAANRANAQLSSGPTSSEGKAKISHNAVKTGLTGRTILLPSDDVAAYQAHVERLSQQFSPETDEEKRLSQSLADTLWRLERIPSLEAGIYAIGRRELAAQFSDETDETVRRAMIESQILLTYRRDLTNLSLQESRLRRQYEKDEAQLKSLLAERQAATQQREKDEKARWDNAIRHYKTAEEYGVAFDPAEIGFEFSSAEIAQRIRQEDRHNAIKYGRYYEYKAKGYLKAA
ncbi:MAG TPA: hypothetical protein VHZ55_21850 [Bryobacteraceae bacterium]|nr:hypothetical protein [Bryobacteraceae bacterium]